MDFGIQYAHIETLDAAASATATTTSTSTRRRSAARSRSTAATRRSVVNQINDVIDIGSTGGVATVYGGDGNDTIRVNYDGNGNQTFLNGLSGTLTLHGGTGSDLYQIGLSGQPNAANTPQTIINVADDVAGRPGRQPAADLRHRPAGLLPAPRQPGGRPGDRDGRRLPRRQRPAGARRRDGARQLRRLHQRRPPDLRPRRQRHLRARRQPRADHDLRRRRRRHVPGRPGLRLAARRVEPGQRPRARRLLPDDADDAGLPRATASASRRRIFGGTGDDAFTVYHNLAELFLFGQEDNDTFLVRAFVKVNPNDPKAPFTNINGGQGADFISYTVNAPVRIDGGDGLDTLVVLGTEFGDDFVVTDKGIFGAGLYVTYTGVEKVDRRRPGGQRPLLRPEHEPRRAPRSSIGGLGSDTFDIGGGNNGQPITVVSNSLKGHSGLIAQLVHERRPRLQQPVGAVDLGERLRQRRARRRDQPAVAAARLREPERPDGHRPRPLLGRALAGTDGGRADHRAADAAARAGRDAQPAS